MEMVFACLPVASTCLRHSEPEISESEITLLDACLRVRLLVARARRALIALLVFGGGSMNFKRMSATQFRVALNVLLVVSGFGLLVAAVGISGTPFHGQ